MYRIQKNYRGEYVAVLEHQGFLRAVHVRDPIISEDWEVFQRELRANVDKIQSALQKRD